MCVCRVYTWRGSTTDKSGVFLLVNRFQMEDGDGLQAMLRSICPTWHSGARATDRTCSSWHQSLLYVVRRIYYVLFTTDQHVCRIIEFIGRPATLRSAFAFDLEEICFPTLKQNQGGKPPLSFYRFITPPSHQILRVDCENKDCPPYSPLSNDIA